MSANVMRNPEQHQDSCNTKEAGLTIETVSEYLRNLKILNALIERGLNTTARLRRFDAIAQVTQLYEDTGNLDHLEWVQRAIAEIDANAKERTDDEVIEPAGEELLQYLSSHTHCVRCGKENEICWGLGADGKKEIRIECMDPFCVLAAVFGMSPADFFDEWEKERDQFRRERVEARARQFNRTATEVDYLIERLYDAYLESPVIEATQTAEWKAANQKFYDAYEALIEKGGDFERLAHIFDEELSAIAGEETRDYFERGFRDGMKYQAQLSTAEKEGIPHKVIAIA